ncbi:MAG: hypothetical protein LBQ28_04195 [Prevotellaceae bacterium]|jgi:hypothetical protein|nr:hypothetical protein [Prevotellaceae bacterium]
MSEQQNNTQTVIVHQSANNSNGLGIAGFVLALIALFLGWIPVLGWILWILGLIFSCIGLFKVPKGFAIAGFIISIISFIVLVTAIASLVAAFS